LRKSRFFFADLMTEQQHPVGFNVQSAFIGPGAATPLKLRLLR
jgi:hypothetical protein